MAGKSMFDLQRLALDNARQSLATGDLERLLDIFASDAVHGSLEAGGWTLTPKSELKALLLKRMSGLAEPAWLTDQQRVRIRNISSGHVVASEGVLTGFLASGAPVAQPVLTIARFNAVGKVVDERLYYDMVAARRRALMGFCPREPAGYSTANAPWIVATDSETERRNTALVRCFVDELCNGSPELASRTLSDDVVFTDQSFGWRTEGKEQVLRALDSLFQAMPDLKIALAGLWPADSFVVSESVLTGRLMGGQPPFGVPGDRHVTAHSAEVFTVHSGKIVRCSAYRSLAELSAALGIPIEGGAS